MRIGTADVDISPSWPVPLAGFGTREGARVSRIAHPISVRVVAFDDGEDRALLVSGEVLNWSSESDGRFRAAVAEATGVAGANILFSATHTHSAPQLSHLQVPLLGEVDERYLEHVRSRLVEAACAAVATSREVRATRAAGAFACARQRRAELDRTIGDDPVRVDDEMTVVAFRDRSGSPVCALVHYACHPVTSAELAVSGDFFGVAAAVIERATGALAVPLQGCCGDVNPPHEASGAGLAATEQLGRAMAERALELIDAAEGGAEVALGPLGVAWRSVPLRFARVPEVAELVAAAERSDLSGEWARGLLGNPQLLRRAAACRLQLLTLGDHLRLLAVNGEVTSEYGLHVKAASAGRVLPLAYSNGMIGYIPTARQIAAGGYEVDESAQCYLLPSRFDPSIEEDLLRGIDGLLAGAR